MADETLEAFGARWDKKAKHQVSFEAGDDELAPGFIPLDLPMLDDILGGGFPRGRTSMLIGEPSSGKTLVSQLLIAAAQRHGGTAIYVDAERTFSAKWFNQTGVDVAKEKLLVLRPDSLEQAFDMIVDALRTVEPDVVVIDSVAALVPQAVVEADMEDKDFRGVFPRKMTEGVAKVTIFNKRTAIVLINQLRTAMNVKFGNPESLPGGRALRHACTMVLRTRRGRWLLLSGQGEEATESFAEVDPKEDQHRVGFALRLRTDKNKLAPPWQETELKFKFTGEVDPLGALVTLAIERKVIAASHGFYELPGVEQKVHGREALEDMIRDDEQLRADLLAEVRRRR